MAKTRTKGYKVSWGRYLESGMGARLARLWRSPGFTFAKRFVLWFALLAFLVEFFTLDQGLTQTATAAAVTGTSPLFGLESARAGTIVTFEGGFAYEVAPGCTAVTIAGMLLAAILAYPTTVRRRLLGVAMCLPFTFVVNLLRLDTMGWLGVHIPGAFRVMHELGWEAGVILIGAVGFGLWVRAIDALDHGPGRLQVRAALVSAATFLVLFVGGIWLAVWLDAAGAYGRLLVLASTPVGQALWGAEYPPDFLDVTIKPMLLLTALVGYVALFLAAQDVPVGRRARAALWGAVAPGLLGGLLATLTQGGARLGEVGDHPLSVSVLLLGHLGVPMLAWVLWSTRLRRERLALPGKTRVPRGASEAAPHAGAAQGRAPRRRG